ncbi:7-deoxyloganetin glucosyltransferase-like [Salvia miltiorrhiza]|uniref:7-deoxyloganetin glucosyltransferase-like n=1 Tax=Salvia miltiorrhiza TaxID=226208 RepID=UPI0025ACFE61|nr:7-deoxyloganetin glucosyltransferase-like [Salvia miltiorrhiza]
MQRPHAVVIPYPAQGHLNPLLKLAKLLHSRGFFITFVNTEFNHARLLRSRGPDSVAGLPDFRFAAIPDGLPPSDKDATQDIPQLCESLRKNGLPPFMDLVHTLNRSSHCPAVTCIVSDGHMSFTLDAADRLAVPAIYFFTTSACGFWAHTHVAGLIQRGICPLKDESQISNGYLEATEIEWVEGFRNMRLRDFPSFVRTTDPNDIMINYNLIQTGNAARATAVILNTCDGLEEDVLHALRQRFQKVLSIGPLHLLERAIKDPQLQAIDSSLWKEDDACIPWLDERPPRSVLYVNFGSITVVSAAQLLEFAWGLANCGHHFLWVIRPDLVSGDSAILPRDFSEEIAGRGMMVGWCAQERVLAHPTVGGFLTHCGWNSTIESVAEGLPMICWPFFAEQQTNCRYMCANWRIGVEMEGEVRREKVVDVVKQVMEGEKGKEMRIRARELRDKVRGAAEHGGSSYRNLDLLVNEILLKK